jgi:hypothetical protein
VTEFRLTGVEAIQSTDAEYECTPLLKIDGFSDFELEPVTYSNTLTPLLSSISPRYGSVLGSTLVTLTGTNFGGTAEQTTVLLDDRECVI